MTFLFGDTNYGWIWFVSGLGRFGKTCPIECVFIGIHYGHSGDVSKTYVSFTKGGGPVTLGYMGEILFDRHTWAKF